MHPDGHVEAGREQLAVVLAELQASHLKSKKFTLMLWSFQGTEVNKESNFELQNIQTHSFAVGLLKLAEALSTCNLPDKNLTPLAPRGKHFAVPEMIINTNKSRKVADF